MSEDFKAGQRVRYTGTLTPSLTGKEGKVARIDREGWVVVQFDNDMSPAKCAVDNLERVRAA